MSAILRWQGLLHDNDHLTLKGFGLKMRNISADPGEWSLISVSCLKRQRPLRACLALPMKRNNATDPTTQPQIVDLVWSIARLSFRLR